MWSRPVLCRLCESPVSDSAVRVDRLDAEKLSEWWRRTIGVEFEAESSEEEIICQFCVWDARYTKSLSYARSFYKTKSCSL
jgi:hypothetical protein